MAEIVYSSSVLDDLEGGFEYWVAIDSDAATIVASAISQAVEVLADHPLIARRIDGESRELVTSYSKMGYVAWYRSLPARNQIRILAIRHQRELDYPD